MAGANLSTMGWGATWKVDDTVRKLTIIGQAGGILVNSGGDKCWVDIFGRPSIPITDDTIEGVYPLAVGSSLKLKDNCAIVTAVCDTSKSAVLVHSQ